MSFYHRSVRSGVAIRSPACRSAGRAASAAASASGAAAAAIIILFVAVADPQNAGHNKEHDHVQELRKPKRKRDGFEAAFFFFFGANVRRVVLVSAAKCFLEVFKVSVAKVGVEAVGARLLLVCGK